MGHSPESGGDALGTALPSAGKRRLACAILLAVTLPLGLVLRLAPLHLPQFAFKYGGSALWAIAVYWTLAMLLPHARPVRLAIVAATVAAGVELFKLVRWPLIDRFRETLAGQLLLGRYFTSGAIVAYWLAIGAAAYLDWASRPGRSQSHAPGR